MILTRKLFETEIAKARDDVYKANDRMLKLYSLTKKKSLEDFYEGYERWLNLIEIENKSIVLEYSFLVSEIDKGRAVMSIINILMEKHQDYEFLVRGYADGIKTILRHFLSDEAYEDLSKEYNRFQTENIPCSEQDKMLVDKYINIFKNIRAAVEVL